MLNQCQHLEMQSEDVFSFKQSDRQSDIHILEVELKAYAQNSAVSKMNLN